MANNEFGDFQTPLVLAHQCLKILNVSPDSRVLEPTCGIGAFLQAAATLAPKSERIGIEINPDYVSKASSWGKVLRANIFEIDFSKSIRWSNEGSLFVVGNPPWVTSAELKRMGSKNLPPKENFKGTHGLEALLGSSNFDVSEFIILKILSELSPHSLVFGMLCKTQIARNIIEYAAKIKLPIHNAQIYKINARRWFGAAVDACWFTLRMDYEVPPDYTVGIFSDVFSEKAENIGRFGIINSEMVSDVDKYISVCEADGKSPYEWRSGLKHDASNVFELTAGVRPTTKAGVAPDIEPEYIFPFLKSTDIFRGRHHELSKWVIVPQREFGTDTSHLRYVAPRLWSYLMSNAEVLDGRKSSIYRNKPRFSVFGHGTYTYAPFKVVISGLHKEPIFRLVTPIRNQPVVVDDTCYLLPFDDVTEAILVTSILNSPECLSLIDSLVFKDSKRPITKKLLSRIDLNRLPVDPLIIVAKAEQLADNLKLRFNRERGLGMVGKLGSSRSLSLGLF